MEITVGIFDKYLSNLAQLYTESIYRLEIPLQLKRMVITEFVSQKNFQGNITQLIAHHFRIPT